MKLSYAILGTGAIGGYCAVKLSRAGFSAHCLLRSDFSHVSQHGLAVVSQTERITANVHAYQHIDDMPVCDVVLIALKTTENKLLQQMLPKTMHAKTIVVVLQNGIGAEQEIAKFVAADRIIGGMCMLKVSKESPGVIRHFAHNSIELAQYYNHASQEGITEQVEVLSENFIHAGIPCTASPHLTTTRWKKLVANIPISGLAVMLNASTLEMVENTASFELICAITREVISVAVKCGAKIIPEEFFQFRVDVLQSFKNLPKSYSSMKEDFDAKRPLELRAIYENAIAIAQENGCEMPLTKMLFLQLQCLDQQNLSQSVIPSGE